MRLKKLRMILLSCVIVVPLLFSGTAQAQDEEGELPDPGITPDSPFYFLDLWGEKAGLLFAFGAEAKAERALGYAEERLAEAHTMAIRNRVRALERATNGYEEHMSLAIQKMEEARNKGVDISEVSEIVASATAKHLFVLDEVEDIVPEEAQEAIVQAKGVSINGHGNALRALAGENPGRAIGINLAAVEGRLNRANAEADKNNPEGAGDAIDDFVQLSGFGQEISQIAQGLGKDITTVDQLVASATSIHLEVLAEVYDKVPEQARSAIERAMTVSVRGHERAVEALEEKGALGRIPEEPPIPEVVPEKVKEKLLELGVPGKPEIEKPEIEEPEIETPEIEGPENGEGEETPGRGGGQRP